MSFIFPEVEGVSWLKRPLRMSGDSDEDVRDLVSSLLREIESGGESAVRSLSSRLDGWVGEIEVSSAALDRAESCLSETVKSDIEFSFESVRRFADFQRGLLSDSELELRPGVLAGQRQIPVGCAGCYVPGGRYAHVASAIMTATTAKCAGVETVVACSPPGGSEGIPSAILYALRLCGADRILCLGGVQGVASLAFGLFGCPRADVLAGPGNKYVAEAKRLLYGRVGIDMFAGPTETLIIADSAADPWIAAVDLVSQAEHGPNSPAVLIALDESFAVRISDLVLKAIDSLPSRNSEAAMSSWRDYGGIAVASSRESASALSDAFAPEHLQVLCDDLEWWKDRLRAYGSLFLGEETTVTFGDKASGPNHVLPTKLAARYTGGLSVAKFLKTVTWQRLTREGTEAIAPRAARISRLEGMEGHARSADVRLAKYFPDRSFDLGGGVDG